MTRRRSPSSKAGFTLMEALVALAIAAVVIAAVMGLQHQLIDSQIRYDATLKASNLQRDALALVKDINPVDKPEGEIPLPPDLTVSWVGEPVSEDKLTAGFPRGDGNYTATLYALTVSVQDGRGKDVIPPFKVERVGWVSANEVAAAPAAPGGAPGSPTPPGGGRGP